VIIGPRAVDCAVGLVRDPGIWPIVRLVTCTLHMSSRQFAAACKGGGSLVFVFGEPGAFRMTHTIVVGDYGGGLPVLVLSFVIRRSGSILRYL
jgi:hypothetical protein